MAGPYTIFELSKATGLQPRTLRHYAAQGFIAKAVFRGKATTYTEDQLIQVLAMRALLTEMQSPQAKAAMKKMTPEELRAKAGLPPVQAEPPPSPPPTPSPAESILASGEGWSRLALLPGLELHVRTDAKDFVRRVAREISEKYASR